MALPLTAGVLGATANHTEPGGLLHLWWQQERTVSKA